MSRIIVKNLPKNITEDKLRDIFSQKGLITDVQLKYTPDGKFRQFAFVGYQNENDAEDAIKAYNNTRINTTKITVEPCALLGDEKKPRAWSKYATDSSAYKKLHGVKEPEHAIPEDTKKSKKKKKRQDEEAAALLEKYKDDPLFEEFAQLQGQGAKTSEILSSLKNKNDDSGQESADETTTQNEAEEEATKSGEESEESIEDKAANKAISDLEYMQLLKEKKSEPRKRTEKKQKEKIDLFTAKLKGLPYNCKKKDIKQFFHPLSLYSLRIPRNIKGIAFVGFKTEDKLRKALLKDRSILCGKRVFVMKYVNEHKEEEKSSAAPMQKKWVSQEESLKNEESIAESGKIFLRNLAYTMTESDVQELFEKYGPIAEVNLPIDVTTRKPKGFGVVTFVMPEHAVRAYSELDRTIQQGRLLHLLPGKAKDDAENDNDDDNASNFKKKKAAKQKSQAGQSHNWNSLFLGHDAVANVIADTYGTSKEAVLDPHGSSNAAVRLALGETQIVTATKKYLEQEGVKLDAFDRANTKRSKTIILVKNLPANTLPKELHELFAKHGVIGRLILPPSGITALVEFLEPTEARKAFSKLAYSKFKYLPLYLEWAPEDSLLPNTKSNNNNTNSYGSETTGNEPSKEAVKEEINEEPEEEEELEDPEPDTTLFVKNLNFETTDVSLKKHFAPCGKIFYAKVATKKDKSVPNKLLSMGYGFVQFVYKDGANNALKTLQQSMLDGKSLELKRSERTLQNEVRSNRKTQVKTKQTGTKILVRNIPFQAKKTEIFELFKTFGEIKALRLPKKLTPGADSHRGFCFVDYVVNSDAKKAFEALCQSTHLYGRRLVLEWASGEEGVDELRKRTADHFHQSEKVKSKKSVLDFEKLQEL